MASLRSLFCLLTINSQLYVLFSSVISFIPCHWNILLGFMFFSIIVICEIGERSEVIAF